MDSVTHIVVGAIIGEACAGKTLGKRAMVLGAAAQSLPDIDVVTSLWLNPADSLLAHRGITHSFLFGACASVVLALVLERRYRVHGFPLKKWIFFLGIEIFTHLFLDAFNAYGVGWFEPFSQYRVSWNVLFVADPLFLAVPGVVFIVLTISRNEILRKRLAWLAIIACLFYLSYALVNKASVDGVVKKNIQRQNIVTGQYFTTPTACNTWLWFVVVQGDSGYYVGYHSVFDRHDWIDFHYFARHESLLNSVRDQHDVRQLVRFSQGDYTVQTYHDTLVFNDLRFGQTAGWTNPGGKFVFHFYLDQPAANSSVIQRGRVGDFNRKNIASLFKRIRGN